MRDLAILRLFWKLRLWKFSAADQCRFSQYNADEVDVMDSTPGEVTRLLKAMNAGDAAAGEQLLPLVYKELRRIAEAYMRRERPDHTLQTTALIHEAYLRLVGEESVGDLDGQR